jgi:hypothetical protein
MELVNRIPNVLLNTFELIQFAFYECGRLLVVVLLRLGLR